MQPTLIITLTPDGQIQVNGPIGNKLLCYGLLEMAKDAIRDYQPEAPPILLAQGGLPAPSANGGRKR